MSALILTFAAVDVVGILLLLSAEVRPGATIVVCGGGSLGEDVVVEAEVA
tara:strand:+ start:583 stop:732 length:150 start_codon:yes stop_codon:yes gene_type:complete